MKELLKELCELNGTSGGEKNIAEYIIDKIKDKCDNIVINPLGCVIAEKKGRRPAKNKVMISAHMDEVGLIVTSIRDDGTLLFNCVGGVDPDVCAGRQITVNGHTGVIGTTAVHNLTDEQKNNPLSFEDLFMDIGAENKEQAEKYVSAGDYAYFLCGYEENGGYITAKAIDDRAGCAVMIKMILEDALEYDAVFTFVTQEEVGLRGAGTAAYTVSPDFAIVLEATTAADIPLAGGDKKCCFCGKGAVISYMDKSTIYDRELYGAAKKISAENNIPCQTKLVVAGGNDSGIIHRTRGGIRTAAISAPCRYLHSPSCTAMFSDIEACYALAVRMAEHCAEL